VIPPASANPTSQEAEKAIRNRLGAQAPHDSHTNDFGDPARGIVVADTRAVAAAHSQLRLARGLVGDMRLPWERPLAPERLTLITGAIKWGDAIFAFVHSEGSKATLLGRPGSNPGPPPISCGSGGWLARQCAKTPRPLPGSPQREPEWSSTLPSSRQAPARPAQHPAGSKPSAQKRS
jgi:hypothetical protein